MGFPFYFGKMTLTEGNLSRLPGDSSCGMLSPDSRLQPAGK